MSVASDTTDPEPVTKGYTTRIDAATGFKIWAHKLSTHISCKLWNLIFYAQNLCLK